MNMDKNRYKINWKRDWDEKVGLWSQQGGHTRPVAHLKYVHSSVVAANRLLLAAQTGQFGNIDVDRILRRLRQMQTRKGELHGCLRWYWQEKHPVDTNAAFFVGLPMIVVWQVYRSGLSKKQQGLLLSILKDLYIWFMYASSTHSWFYPNKSLGDVVCAWLLYEICSKDDRKLREDAKRLSSLMLEAADYWLKNGWGWGEHLSDGYSRVCLNELSVLLLLSENLPEKVRNEFKKLFSDMLAVEDAYDGGPRVPALRSYSFLSCAEHKNFRDTVAPLPARIDIANIQSMGHTLYHLNWHRLSPPRKMVKEDLKIDCFDGAVARAHIEKDIRAGSVSHFPLMSSIEHFTHGLAWQSMPVALSRPGKTWMFLQWETKESGRLRCHPAEVMKTARDNALSKAVHPPIVGQTWSLQQGGAVITLRIMPQISTSWSYLTDRLRVIGETGDIQIFPVDGIWSQMLLHWGKRELSIHCIPLIFNGSEILAGPVLKRGKKATDWDITYPKKLLQGKRLIVTLWALYLGGKVDSAPEISLQQAEPVVPRALEERRWQVIWNWPGKKWRIMIDPLSKLPLEEIEV